MTIDAAKAFVDREISTIDRRTLQASFDRGWEMPAQRHAVGGV